MRVDHGNYEAERGNTYHKRVGVVEAVTTPSLWLRSRDAMLEMSGGQLQLGLYDTQIYTIRMVRNRVTGSHFPAMLAENFNNSLIIYICSVSSLCSGTRPKPSRHCTYLAL